MTVVSEAEKVLKGCGVETVVCLPFPMDDHFRFAKKFDWKDLEEEAEGTDMLICFGGDGTILHLARFARTHNIPILGVNTGSLASHPDCCAGGRYLPGVCGQRQRLGAGADDRVQYFIRYHLLPVLLLG